MKLLTFSVRDLKNFALPGYESQLGILINSTIVPIRLLGSKFPNDMLSFLQGGAELQNELRVEFLKSIGMDKRHEKDWSEQCISLNAEGLKIEAPIPNPTSFRDAYAFRQHVETSRKNRGLPMIPEFDAFPVFYFSNHRAISGPGPVEVQEEHLAGLDYELEVAIVIHKEGKNIKAKDADDYIAGFMILNDWSSRVIQIEEMKLNLGPAKGKDFATTLGPWLVTPDELETSLIHPKPGHIGKAYNLSMRTFVNGKLLSEGNLSSMHWTFAEIIERASSGVTLYPGDLIGSGTVGTGCLFELNGTASRLNPDGYIQQWLEVGDKVTLEVDSLGALDNTLVLVP